MYRSLRSRRAEDYTTSRFQACNRLGHDRPSHTSLADTREVSSTGGRELHLGVSRHLHARAWRLLHSSGVLGAATCCFLTF